MKYYFIPKSFLPTFMAINHQYLCRKLTSGILVFFFYQFQLLLTGYRYDAINSQ